MTIVHTVSQRPSSARRPLNGPVYDPRYGRFGAAARSRRPGPSRPAGQATRYYGTGVAMSRAPHRRRSVTWLTTIGLALGAGAITLWLGLVANVGQALNGEAAAPAAHIPDRLTVVKVEPGESLQDLAHRVAPDAPTGQVAQRIRELNDLNSPALVAGQTLITPIG